ncbi:hypothetical protein [Pelobacter propionicus]|nr:hypothetical protein [Pelobacter propionicus]
MLIPRTALPPLPVCAAICAPAFAILLCTALASILGEIQPAFFCRDAMATLEAHPLTGVQSNIGVLIWCATAAVCIFSHGILRYECGVGDGESSFFLCSGLFTALLALDDLFLVHDDLLHRYLGSWAYGKALYVAYGLFMVWYVVRFQNLLLRSEYVLLLVALLFFGTALVIDFFDDLWISPWRIFWEDGFKLTGIITWCGYLTRACFQAIRSRLKAEGGVGGF